MHQHFIYHWVQIMAHHKIKLALIFVFIQLAVLFGLTDYLQYFADNAISTWSKNALSLNHLEPSIFLSELLLLLLAATLISALFAWQAESLKSGVIHFGLLCLTLFLTLGASGWLSIELDSLTLFSLIVVLTVVTANFTHLLSTLHKEMARGLFQFDALAEAISLNHSPIFLSNLTTALGVYLLAYFVPAFESMAVVLSLGGLISYLLTLSVFPLILLGWFLEFRVGNTRDRNSFFRWFNLLDRLANKRLLKPLLLAMLSLIYVVAFGFLMAASSAFAVLEQTLYFALVFAGLFWLWWRNVRWMLISVGFMLWVATLAVSMIIWSMDNASFAEVVAQLNRLQLSYVDYLLLLMLAPIGIVVDDQIHFFSRLSRARVKVFAVGDDAVKFAMLSVGRPIFITSIILFLAMSLIFFLGGQMVTYIALSVMISVFLVTFIVLFILPLLLLRGSKRNKMP